MSEPIVQISLFRIQTDPNASENPIATAYFKEDTTIDDKVFVNPVLTEVSWPLLSGKTVELPDGTILTYLQISQGVTAIAYQEKAEQEV